MSVNAERAVQEEVPSETAKSDSKVQVGARARETTPSAAIASLPASLTEGDRIAQARAAALLLGTRIQRHLSGPSLWHQAPKSLEEARAHHHGAAGHWEAQLLQGLRLSWGYGVHLPAKGAGHLLDWLTSSPVITVSALLIYTACHYWLLHWLPWF